MLRCGVGTRIAVNTLYMRPRNELQVFCVAYLALHCVSRLESCLEIANTAFHACKVTLAANLVVKMN